MLASAFGATLYYLKYLHIDQTIIPSIRVSTYDLFPKLIASEIGQISASSCPILGVDGSSLVNLEIFQNSIDGTSSGTLFDALDNCITPMGRRKLKYWLVHPLTSIPMIRERQDSISIFCKQGSSLDKFVLSYLKGQPDIERLISRARSRQAKLKEYVLLLDSLVVLISFLENLKSFLEKHLDSVDISLRKESKLFKLVFEHSLDLTHLESLLTSLRDSFDRKAALEQGELKLNSGKHSDPAYTSIEKKAASVEKSLDSYLSQMKKELRCSEIKFRDIGNTIYQLEIPSKNCNGLPKDFLLMSKTKTVQRYWTPFIKENVKELEQTKELRSSYLSNLLGSFLDQFNEKYESWQAITEIISDIDCLYSLFIFKENRLQTSCPPQLVASTTPFFHARDLGMYIRQVNLANDFIANDIFLGTNCDCPGDGLHPQAVILTGPNMGGKSTLLRQICLCVILAQLGSFVPASSLEMSVFDRIFTRIGAQDNILAGKSTFKVELEETSRILNEATPFSLVILDELGRGTSTLDGHAVAYSVFHSLVSRIGCLSLFSTHYRRLTSDFISFISKTIPRPLGLWHMSCMVDEHTKEVVFLYKLSHGVCPKSYGMNVARLAGIPDSVCWAHFISLGH